MDFLINLRKKLDPYSCGPWSVQYTSVMFAILAACVWGVYLFFSAGIFSYIIDFIFSLPFLKKHGPVIINGSAPLWATAEAARFGILCFAAAFFVFLRLAKPFMADLCVIFCACLFARAGLLRGAFTDPMAMPASDVFFAIASIGLVFGVYSLAEHILERKRPGRLKVLLDK